MTTTTGSISRTARIARVALGLIAVFTLNVGCGGRDKGGNRSPIFNTGVGASVIEPGGNLPRMPPPILVPPGHPGASQQGAHQGARAPATTARGTYGSPDPGSYNRSSRGGAQSSAPTSTASQGGARVLSPGANPGAPPPGYPSHGGPPQGYPPHGGQPPGYPPHGGQPSGYPPHGGQPSGYPYPAQGRGPEGGGGGGMVSIGGATTIDTRTEKRDMKPVEALATNPLFWPVAIVAWPFKKMVESRSGSAQQSRSGGPNTPTNFPEPLAPEEVDRRQDREQTLAMERALESQTRGAPRQPSYPSTERPYEPPRHTRAPQRQAPPPSAATYGGPPTIAQELEALRRRAGTSHAGVARGTRGSQRGGAAPEPWRGDRSTGFPTRDVADPQRQRFDDNGDGIPDREEVYDADGLIAETAEDADRDGAIDTWTRYRNGAPLRRRADANGDGLIDAWTYYAEGGLDVARLERDTNGDGYRDQIDFFDSGALARRTEDPNGDGMPERITRFDADGRPTERDEDSDGDGALDTRSYYESGRLVRRVLLNEDERWEP